MPRVGADRHQSLYYLRHLCCPIINEVRLVFLLLCVPAWALFLAGCGNLTLLLWHMSESEDVISLYSVGCCIASSLTGCVCLVSSFISEKAWQNLIPHIVAESIGVLNILLLGHCLLTSWEAGAWTDSDSEEMIHKIGAIYTRLEFTHAYSLMFLGGYCCSLFWGVSRVLTQPYFETQLSKPQQVSTVSMITPSIAYWIVFVITFSYVCKCHNEVMEYVPCWLLWLRGGGLVAAVLYVSSTVYFALGWRGHNYIVTCGLMVTVCAVALLVLNGVSYQQQRVSLDLIQLQHLSILLVIVSSVVYLVCISLQGVANLVPFHT